MGSGQGGGWKVRVGLQELGLLTREWGGESFVGAGGFVTTWLGLGFQGLGFGLNLKARW